MKKKAGELFKRQLDFARKRSIFADCPYYPCHKDLDGGELDCTFCYCPFYPCRNKIGSGKWIYDKKSGRIWDCSSCGFIHRGDVVSRIFELIYKDKKISKIKKTIRDEFCR